MSKFEIKKDKAGEFRFNLKAGNGQVILSSEGYKAKASCMDGIESVKKNSQSDSNFDRKDSEGNYRFNLKSTNSQIIGTSESYTTANARENGIESVKTNAKDASTEDNS